MSWPSAVSFSVASLMPNKFSLKRMVTLHCSCGDVSRCGSLNDRLIRVYTLSFIFLIAYYNLNFQMNIIFKFN